jgi:hypothetical protein
LKLEARIEQRSGQISHLGFRKIVRQLATHKHSHIVLLLPLKDVGVRCREETEVPSNYGETGLFQDLVSSALLERLSILEMAAWKLD